jgi:hypothetical protein
MPEIPAHLVEIGRSFEQTYKPVLAFEGWRVAMLRHFDIVDVAGLRRVERHRNTNEVFILTTGEADLVLFDGGDTPTDPYIISMETNVAYNVRRSVWHHVVMSQESHIILLEHDDTSVETSDYAELDIPTLSAVKTALRLAAKRES